MTVRRFLTTDIPAVNRLHHNVWWPERAAEGWRWLDDNPVRRLLDAPAGWVIENDDGQAAAFLGNFTQRFWIGDRPLYGATGFSVIVPPALKGRSRDLITAFLRQPGCFIRYTLNANARSCPLYQRYGMRPWPPATHALKLSWILNPTACLYSRGLRAIVAREPRAARWLGEQLMPLGTRSQNGSSRDLEDGVRLFDDVSDAPAYSRFWDALRDQGRPVADRSPAMLRWRLTDPDMTHRPVRLVRGIDDEITAHALALLGKGNSIEPPALEILDLEALDRDRAAIPALVAALLRLAPSLALPRSGCMWSVNRFWPILAIWRAVRDTKAAGAIAMSPSSRAPSRSVGARRPSTATTPSAYAPCPRESPAGKGEATATRRNPRRRKPERGASGARLEFVADLGQQGLGRGRGGGLGRLLATHLVDALDQQEDHKGHDQELDQGVDEGAVLDRHLLDGFGRRIFGHQDPLQLGEVHLAQQQADGRHDDLIDQAGDDLAERGADDDADRQVDNIAARGEFTKLGQQAHSSVFRFKRRQKRSGALEVPCRS